MRYRFAIILISVIGYCSVAMTQETSTISIEDLVGAGTKSIFAAAKKEESGAKIPGYSRSEALAKGKELNNKTEANLKTDAEQQINNARKDEKGRNGATIVLKADERRKEGDSEAMAKHTMFSRADEIYADPLGKLNSITKEECSRILENQKLHKSHKVKEKRKTIEYEEKICEVPNNSLNCEKFLEVICEEKKAECNAGSIILGTIEGDTEGSTVHDMKFEYNYPNLLFETTRDNQWEGECKSFVRSAFFKIANKDDIEEFKIKRVKFDDYILIKVNEVLVYSGPYGGDRLELAGEEPYSCGSWVWWGSTCYRKLVTTGIGARSRCELNTNWEYNLDIDVKSHLKEGLNKIWIKVMVGDKGEGEVKISAKQKCCSKFKKQWRKRCLPN